MNFQTVRFECAFGQASQLGASECPEFVFTGRSNVGKSSLINTICGRKNLARTSATPGKTATINFYRADSARFVDLPGYGYARASKDEKRRLDGLIRGYFSQDRNVGLVFLLVDMRHPPAAADVEMANFLIDAALPFAVALTKADKLSKTQREERLFALQNELPCADQLKLIPFSSANGEGAEDIRAIIRELCDDGETIEEE
jgi:GTP-binding protein